MKSYKFHWDESKALARNARSELPAMVKRYFKAGRDTFEGKTSVVALHSFRLQTKRIRYTLEMFREVYGPALDAMIRGLRGLQQLLGDINDCETARKLAQADGDKRSLAVRRVLRTLERTQARRLTEVERMWREFDHPEACRRWMNYLAVFPGRARRSRPAVAKKAPKRALAASRAGRPEAKQIRSEPSPPAPNATPGASPTPDSTSNRRQNSKEALVPVTPGNT